MHGPPPLLCMPRYSTVCRLQCVLAHAGCGSTNWEERRKGRVWRPYCSSQGLIYLLTHLLPSGSAAGVSFSPEWGRNSVLIICLTAVSWPILHTAADSLWSHFHGQHLHSHSSFSSLLPCMTQHHGKFRYGFATSQTFKTKTLSVKEASMSALSFVNLSHLSTHTREDSHQANPSELLALYREHPVSRPEVQHLSPRGPVMTLVMCAQRWEVKGGEQH